jgi:hypothetical protein
MTEIYMIAVLCGPEGERASQTLSPLHFVKSRLEGLRYIKQEIAKRDRWLDGDLVLIKYPIGSDINENWWEYQIESKISF